MAVAFTFCPLGRGTRATSISESWTRDLDRIPNSRHRLYKIIVGHRLKHVYRGTDSFSEEVDHTTRCDRIRWCILAEYVPIASLSKPLSRPDREGGAHVKYETMPDSSPNEPIATNRRDPRFTLRVSLDASMNWASSRDEMQPAPTTEV